MQSVEKIQNCDENANETDRMLKKSIPITLNNNQMRTTAAATKTQTIAALQSATATATTTPTAINNTNVKKFDDIYRELEMTDETTCGIWFIRAAWLQKFANKKAYVFLYGVLGCIYSATYAYFNGTITTLEKRFKIPSRTTGIITVGNDMSQLLVSVVLSYYAGRGHKPRWMAFGLYTVVLFCVLTALPHFIYGPGEDALQLTKEYNSNYLREHGNLSSISHLNDMLCHDDKPSVNQCDNKNAESNIIPQLILFVAQLISGIGGSLYYTLGVAYMDDNIKKSKTPALISFSYFLRMLGPAIGYALASFCLKLYIQPELTPTITMSDPRWMGAWWLGWLILAAILFFTSSLLALFPKTLPRAALRRRLAQEKMKNAELDPKSEQNPDPEISVSFKDMMKTFKRLLMNRTLMLNNLAAVFYFFGYMPYWIFMPKYIETQYRQSASLSSLITGTVGLIFSAIGILLSGLVITKFKPKARYLAAWNVLIGAVSVIGIISYAFLGCEDNDNNLSLLPNGDLEVDYDCNSKCNCDYVKYSPVCSEDGARDFISACYAGCKTQIITPNGTKIFSDCSCIAANTDIRSKYLLNESEVLRDTPGIALPGYCKVDCMSKFYIFLAVVCFLKFSGATGRASNFLVSVRCVDEKDKPVAMGFGLMIMSLCAFVPSPILFGIILDKACLIWGKTCTGTGNCWFYNGQILRYTMNFTAAAFVCVGTFFDVGVWYYVKDLKIFDDELELGN